MAKRKAKRSSNRGACRRVTFRKKCTGSKRKHTYRCHAVKPVTVTLCAGRKRKATNKNQCRKSDMGVRGKHAHEFVSCRAVARAQARRARRG